MYLFIKICHHVLSLTEFKMLMSCTETEVEALNAKLINILYPENISVTKHYMLK